MRVLRFLTTASLCSLCAASAQAGRHVSVVVDESGEPLVGVTVVATVGEGSTSAVTDATGEAVLHLPNGVVYRLGYYFGESLVRRTGISQAADVRAVVKIATGDQGSIRCFFGPPPIVETTTACSRANDQSRTFELPSAKPRSLPLYPSASTDDTRIWGLALGGAATLPPIALESVEQVHAGAPPVLTSTAGTAVIITPRSGANESRMHVRTLAGTSGFAASGLRTGPLVKDRAWYSAAVDARTLVGDKTARLATAVDTIPKTGHRGSALVAGQLGNNGHHGMWALRWRSEFDNNKLVVDGSVGGAHNNSEPGEPAVALANQAGPKSGGDAQLVSTTAARASLLRRQEWLGQHEIQLVWDGTVRRDTDATRAANTAFALQDSWNVQPHILIDAGVRVDAGQGGEFAWLPRFGLLYDPSREGRSRLFVHVGRYRGDVDERPISIATAALEHEVIEDFAVLGALSVRDGALGGHAMLRARGDSLRGHAFYGNEQIAGVRTHRVEVHGEGRLVGHAWLGAIIREGGQADDTKGSGLALRWTHLPTELAVGLEATRTDGDLGGAVTLDWGL